MPEHLTNRDLPNGHGCTGELPATLPSPFAALVAAVLGGADPGAEEPLWEFGLGVGV